MAYDENVPADSLAIPDIPQAIRQKGADLKTIIESTNSSIQDQLATKANIESPTLTGTTTGNFIETVQNLGTITANTVIDCANGGIAVVTIGAAISIGFTANAAANTCRTLTLILVNGGNYAITWSSTIKWPDGTAPIFTPDGIDIITLMTISNGTTWYGATNGSAFA